MRIDTDGSDYHDVLTFLSLPLPPFLARVKWRSAKKLMDLPLAMGSHSSWEISSLTSAGSWTLAFRLVRNYLKEDYINLILNTSFKGCFLWVIPWDLSHVSSFPHPSAINKKAPGLSSFYYDLNHCANQGLERGIYQLLDRSMASDRCLLHDWVLVKQCPALTQFLNHDVLTELSVEIRWRPFNNYGGQCISSTAF